MLLETAWARGWENGESTHTLSVYSPIDVVLVVCIENSVWSGIYNLPKGKK